MASFLENIFGDANCNPCSKICGQGEQVFERPANDTTKLMYRYEDPNVEPLGSDPTAPLAATKLDQSAKMANGSELEERPASKVEAGATYTGQWLGNLRHGQGVLTRPDGQKYTGSFECGRSHGYGVFIAADGNKYEGEWSQDRAHGFGKYVHMDGSTYEGEWDMDEKRGKGTEYWADGSQYEGEFEHGYKHGKGNYRSATGVLYKGQFKYDKMDG